MSIKKYKKRILFAIIFVIVFLCFFYIQFPNERLKRRVIFEIEKNSNFQAEIERVSLSPPLKIKIRGLKLTKNEFQTIVIPKAELNPAVLSLLSNYISIPYELNIFRGTAKGNLIISKNTNDIHSLTVNIENIDIDQIKKIYSKNLEKNIEIAGLLNGTIKLSENKSGSFDFKIDDLDIMKISVNNFPLPEFLDLKSSLTGQIYKDRTFINELTFQNSEIMINLRGSTPPLWRLSRGSIDLYYRLQVNGKKYAYLKSFLNKDRRGNVAGKIVGSIKKPQLLKNANKSNLNGRRKSIPQFRQTFNSKQHSI